MAFFNNTHYNLIDTLIALMGRAKFHQLYRNYLKANRDLLKFREISDIRLQEASTYADCFEWAMDEGDDYGLNGAIIETYAEVLSN